MGMVVVMMIVVVVMIVPSGGDGGNGDRGCVIMGWCCYNGRGDDKGGGVVFLR